VTAGKQTFPAALKSRIKKRLGSALSPINTNIIKFKCGTIITLEQRIVKVNGVQRRFNGVSYKLLHYFLEKQNRVVSRHELLKSHIWDNSVCSTNKFEQGKAIDMAITRLRRLIEPEPSNPRIITTIHGVGWILEKGVVI